jgi:phosphoribosylcarboxyaminoimidazole (NCAIR) mutase
MAIGSAGARNAAWFAARVLGVSDPEVAARHLAERQALGKR